MIRPQGRPSTILHGERITETWACSACGRKAVIRTPAAKDVYPHSVCREQPQGRYEPPFREDNTTA